MDLLNSVLDDVNGHIHGSVRGFFAKYFDNTSWSSLAKSHGHLTPDLSPLDAGQTLLAWLQRADLGPRESFSTWHVTPSTRSTDPRFYLLSKDSSEFKWARVQVIGHMIESEEGSYKEGSYKDGLLRLCSLAQNVFEAQPTRLFLHGLYVYRDSAEPWVFDRGGIYGGEPINIHQDSAHFKTIVVSYTLIDTVQLGNNPSLEEDATGRCLISAEVDAKPERVQVEHRPLSSVRDIVGGGTAAYRARRASTSGTWDLAVKFKWQLVDDRPVNWLPEEAMLKLVNQRNVWGVVRLLSQHDLSSVERLREGLEFDTPRVFPATAAASNSTANPHVRGVLDFTQPKSQPSTGGNTIRPFQNLILSCLVVAPLGKPLQKFNDKLQLLEALRDAIKGHRDLYNNGILHQDVSIWNVMIVTASGPGDPKGILIDLDMAAKLEDLLPDGRSSVGIPLFMAIEVLIYKRHTYRHDLESFLYVLLWMSITNRSDGLPEESMMKQWTKEGDPNQLAALKHHDMKEEHFETMLHDFDPEFHDVKILARAFHAIIFPTLEDGSLFVGTKSDASSAGEMYQAIIDVFDGAIGRLGAKM